MATLDNLIRELQASAKQRDTEFAGAAAPQLPAYVRLGRAWQPGDRVLDLVTGETGVVIDGKRENVILATAGNAGH